MLKGRMPMSDTMPYNWYDTPIFIFAPSVILKFCAMKKAFAF